VIYSIHVVPHNSVEGYRYEGGEQSDPIERGDSYTSGGNIGACLAHFGHFHGIIFDIGQCSDLAYGAVLLTCFL
jgi:hypothetical protein